MCEDFIKFIIIKSFTFFINKSSLLIIINKIEYNYNKHAIKEFIINIS
jgi:hypothetical protein